MIDLPDIDIDLADRDRALSLFDATPARLESGQRHNTGVYFTDIPRAADGAATLDHKSAEQLGYFKLDMLNMSVYEKVRDELHLVELMTQEPPWHRLWDEPQFCERVIHVGNHYGLVNSMRPDSIPRMAMLLAVMRPGKSHLRNQPWKTIAETVWDRNVDGYTFRRSHAVAYAHLVAVHINLLNSLD